MRKKVRSEIICRCNNVPRDVIEDAIKNGACDTLNKIFDATTAGVGPCGGSCRRKLKPLLEHYLKTGEFPEKIVEDMTGKEIPPKKEDPS
ncbi:(2Fe-2S)-binding protein [Bdellovibrio sp. HCB337]|uniref:(2Fe-2S)-binding protein n=1 Tax=Bdellovibrio sp. HCB337 TaxID=3394358 RepID=UPI0039A4A5D1